MSNPRGIGKGTSPRNSAEIKTNAKPRRVHISVENYWDPLRKDSYQDKDNSGSGVCLADIVNNEWSQRPIVPQRVRFQNMHRVENHINNNQRQETLNYYANIRRAAQQQPIRAPTVKFGPAPCVDDGVPEWTHKLRNLTEKLYVGLQNTVNHYQPPPPPVVQRSDVFIPILNSSDVPIRRAQNLQRAVDIEAEDACISSAWCYRADTSVKDKEPSGSLTTLENLKILVSIANKIRELIPGNVDHQNSNSEVHDSPQKSTESDSPPKSTDSDPSSTPLLDSLLNPTLYSIECPIKDLDAEWAAQEAAWDAEESTSETEHVIPMTDADLLSALEKEQVLPTAVQTILSSASLNGHELGESSSGGTSISSSAAYMVVSDPEMANVIRELNHGNMNHHGSYEDSEECDGPPMTTDGESSSTPLLDSLLDPTLYSIECPIKDLDAAWAAEQAKWDAEETEGLDENEDEEDASQMVNPRWL